MKELDNEQYEIPKEKIIKTQEILFDFVADQVASFIKDRKITQKLPMGFTFSFPVHNTSLTSGTLVRWTKCFDADGAVGEDPVRLLREAFDRKGVGDLSVYQITTWKFEHNIIVCLTRFKRGTVSNKT